MLVNPVVERLHRLINHGLDPRRVQLLFAVKRIHAVDLLLNIRPAEIINTKNISRRTEQSLQLSVHEGTAVASIRHALDQALNSLQ